MLHMTGSTHFNVYLSPERQPRRKAFRKLLRVVKHYDRFFDLGLTNDEKHYLVEYLKSL